MTEPTPTEPAAPPARGRLRKRWLIPLGLLVGLLAAEGALRVVGFSFRIEPRFEFAPRGPVFVGDADLFWVKTGYHDELAQLAQGRPDIVFMGDSCTHQGHYHDYLVQKIAPLLGRTPRTGNVGVIGWSSFQGRRQFFRDVVPLAPRIVTLYYGWNDHWVGIGLEDKAAAEIRTFAGTPVADLRLAQLWAKASIAVDPALDARPNRVSAEDFRENLTVIVRGAKERGIIPVLITAPTSHEAGKLPKKMLGEWLRDMSELVPLHQQYVAVVREVAAAEGVVLCDLEARFAKMSRRSLQRDMFDVDGIHPKLAGDMRVAEFLLETFREAGLIDLLKE